MPSGSAKSDLRQYDPRKIPLWSNMKADIDNWENSQVFICEDNETHRGLWKEMTLKEMQLWAPLGTGVPQTCTVIK